MFTMAKIRDGSTYLSAHLSANDYYAEHESVRGQWTGEGARRLGLRGEIGAGDAAFEALRNNRHPLEGGKLTPRDRDDRIRFFDFQCSAQKSVSIMAVTMEDGRLLAAHDRAASIAFFELERFAACQENSFLERRYVLTGNVVAASFRHTASRALDPQVHTHFVVANATWNSATDAWRALTEFEMLAAIRYAGKTYQNEMARACRALGYEIAVAQDDRGAITGFEIAGVTAEICQRYSKRRAEIETGIAAFETRTRRSPTTAEIHAIVVDTRSSKLAEIATAEVLARQRGELSDAELEVLRTLRSAAEQRSRETPTHTENAREAEVLHHAAAHLFERRSVVLGHALVAEALNTALGFVDHTKLCGLASRSSLVRLTDQPWLHAAYATHHGLAVERWSIAFVDRTRGTQSALGAPVESALAALSAEQCRAVEEVLCNRDQVFCLRGAAGVGKTTVQTALNASFAVAGLEVCYCAPTTSAADTLRREGLTGATTVRDFLLNIAPLADPRLERSLLVVDEAGLTSNRDGAEILQFAERWNARVLFVGDSRQHTAVEAGDFLRVLESHSLLGRVELDAIRRQQTLVYREAIVRLASGSTRAGLERLDALGWVREHGPDYLHQAAAAAIERSEGGMHFERVLVVTPTWSENDALTQSLREELKRRGILTLAREVEIEEPLPWTEAEKRRATSYRVGMVVTFTKGRRGVARGTSLSVSRIERECVWLAGKRVEIQIDLRKDKFEIAAPRMLEVCLGDRLLMRANDRDQGINNGDILTVVALDGDVLRAADGRVIDLARFRRFAHGFVVTSHKSQSKTADHVVVAAQRLDAKSAYVACSRGKYSAILHVPAKQALFESLPPGDREAALDVLRSSRVSDQYRPSGAAARVILDPTRMRKSSLLLRLAALPAWSRRIGGRIAEWWHRVQGDHASKRDSATIPDPNL